MSVVLTAKVARQLVPNLPAGSDLVYWRTAANLASDRRASADLNAMATFFHDAAEAGLGHLFQRRRRDRRAAGLSAVDRDGAGGAGDGIVFVTDYCFRKS